MIESALVSVIVPSYNHAAFLEPCIASVLAQTYRDWEIVVVDDGSSDASLELLNKFASDRVRIYSNDTNLGTYGTQARAVELAQGDFIAVLNSDDIWAPEKLELQLRAFAAHPSCVLCFTEGHVLELNGEIRPQLSLPSNWPKSIVQNPRPYLLESNPILASGVIFRKPVAAFDPSLRYSGDWVALLRALTKGPAAFIDAPLTTWRMHDRNSFRRSPGQVTEEIRIRQSIFASQTSPRTELEREHWAANAAHLAALLVLTGRFDLAKQTMLTTFSWSKRFSILKRLVAVNMPRAYALNKLWGPDAAVLECESNSQPIPLNL